jgi:hypothetical protein
MQVSTGVSGLLTTSSERVSKSASSSASGPSASPAQPPIKAPPSRSPPASRIEARKHWLVDVIPRSLPWLFRAARAAADSAVPKAPTLGDRCDGSYMGAARAARSRCAPGESGLNSRSRARRPRPDALGVIQCGTTSVPKRKWPKVAARSLLRRRQTPGITSFELRRPRMGLPGPAFE